MSQYKINALAVKHAGSRPHQRQRVAVLAAPRAPGFVLALLADGAPDEPEAQAGRAADQVIQTAIQLFGEFSPVGATAPAPGAVRAVRYANDLDKLEAMLRALVEEAHVALGLATGAGAPAGRSGVAALVLTPAREAIWLHVGEVRIYHFRAGALLGKTTDQAYLAHLATDPALAPAAIKSHRQLPMLANTLGSAHRTPFASITRCAAIGAGDAFLLCSAGLWSYFTDAELGSALARMTPRTASEKLLAKAGERAGAQADNCTFAILRLDAPG